jgi:5,10-methylenetetrahydromethanopterin reductase
MSKDKIKFGINFLPNAALELVEWVKTAEDTGFAIAGIADSQSLYRDVYMCEALAAVNTKTITIGTRVINPLTRHPAIAACAAATLEEIAPGRTMVGIGTGDSAVDNIGVRPSTRAEMVEYIKVYRELLTTGQSTFTPGYGKEPKPPTGIYTGEPVKMTWWKNKNIPIYIAASGPLALQTAGEVADGVVINTGMTPEIVADSIKQVKIGCERAGRDISEVDMWWLPLTNVDDNKERAINEIAPTLASAGSHLSRFTTKGKHIPDELMSRISELGRRYNSDQHDKPDSANRELAKELGLLDYLAERFSVAGSPKDCIKKLEGAIDAGARQFWMSVHLDNKIKFMKDWSSQVMTAFN